MTAINTESNLGGLVAGTLTPPQTHVYQVDDGGGLWWYVATSPADALEQHRVLVYVTGGILDEWGEVDGRDVSLIDDDRKVTLNIEGKPMVRTAREWADLIGPGLLGTTEC